MEFRLIIFNIQSTVNNVKSTFIIISFRNIFFTKTLAIDINF